MQLFKYTVFAILMTIAAVLISLPGQLKSSSNTEFPESEDFNFRIQAEKLWNNGDSEGALILLQTALDFKTDDHAAVTETHNEYLHKIKERNSALGKLKAFGFSFLTGQVNSFEELAGSSVADFFLYGDIRDLGRELIFEDRADPFITSLSAAGLLTSIFPPCDASVSILKSAKKSNILTATLKQQITKSMEPLLKGTKSLSTASLKMALDSLKPVMNLAGKCKTWKQLSLFLKNCNNLKQLKFINKVLEVPGNSQKLSRILVMLNKFPQSSQAALGFIRNYGQKGMDTLYGALRKGPKSLQFLIKNPKKALRAGKNAVKANQLAYNSLETSWLDLKKKYGTLAEILRFGLIGMCIALVFLLFKKSGKSVEVSKSSKLNLALIIAGIILSLFLVKQNLSSNAEFENAGLSQTHNSSDNFPAVSSLVLFLVFVAAQAWAFFRIKNELLEISLETKISVKLKMIDNAEFYFDLPIYLGLCGTVFSFVILTFDPSGSRMLAYGTTVSGILLSLYLRGVLLMPLKKELVKESE